MAELTPRERLQPALLDRLTDNEPHRNVEAREQREMFEHVWERADVTLTGSRL